MSQAISTSSRTDKTFYTVNVRLLVGTVVVAVLAGALGYVWYQYRLGQTADAILARADKLEAEGKWGEAAAYYQRYLLADPENTDVLVQLIGVQNKGEPSPAKLFRLNNLLYRTLGRLPEREDLRLMLAENLLKTGEWEEAEAEATKLSEGSPDVVQKARKVIAVSKLRRLGVDHTISAAATLKELIAAAEELPSDHELSLVTAVAIRSRAKEVPSDLGDPAKLADHLVDQTVAAQPTSVDALMARFAYRQLYSLSGAQEDLAAALRIDPDNTDALLASAISKVTPQSSAADLETANTELRKVITAAPEDMRAYRALVEVLKLQDRKSEAISLLQDVIVRVDAKFEFQLALAALQLEARQVDDAKSTLERLQGGEGAAFLTRLETKQRDLLENRLQILAARIALAEKNIAEATFQLKTIYLKEDVAAATEPSMEWAQACQLLAAIYLEQGAWDQAGNYSDALLRRLPGDARSAEVAVQSAIRAGNGKRALDFIDRYGRPEQLTENLLVLRVQALLLTELQHSPADRNWEEFEQTLQAALAKFAHRPELLFAQIERLKAESGDKEDALALLREGEQRSDKSRDFWRGATLQYAQLGATSDQERALARYKSLESSVVEETLVEAAVLARNGRFVDADRLLTDAIATLPADQQAIIQLRRIETLAQRGEVAKASNVVNKVLEASAVDSKLLRLGAELALATGDVETAKKWEQKLAAVTDNGADSKVLKVKRLLGDYPRLSEEERQQLADTISAVRSERPEWFEIVSLAGRFAELAGDRRQAVEDFRLAVNLGDRREYTLQQLVTLLYGLNLFEEADHYLALLASDQSASNFVDSMGIELAVKRGRPTGAIDAARHNVEKYPQDASRRIYLANLLLAYGAQSEAEAVLRQASQDLPGDLRIWLGLVSFLAKSNRQSEAVTIMATIEGSTDIDAKHRHALLAKGHDLVGDYAAAAKNYQAAIQQDPDNIQLRLSLARSLTNRSIRDAIAEYQRILELAPTNREAQSELAVALASTGNPDDWARASQLLEDAESGSATASSTKVLLRALLLSRQGRTRAERIAKCQAARKVLEQHLQVVSAAEADSDRLMLAQIIEQEANLSGEGALLVAARDQLQQVVEGTSPTVERQSRFIEFLLRNADKVEEKVAFLNVADEQLEKLRKTVSRDDIGTTALCTVLAAQLSKAQGNEIEADRVVEEFVTKQTPQNVNSNAIPTLLIIGRLYTTVGNHVAAEKTYRQILELAPNAYVLVVQSLLEQDKRQEAAQLCLDLAPDGLSAEMAQTLAAIMTTPEGEDGLEFPEADAVLQAALDEYPTNAGLLQADAIRRASRGDYAAAIAAFRNALRVDPQNSLALNNLATLLAEKSELRDEALQVIQQAIQFAGRQPSLLDTKGTILLKMGRADEAIVDLEEATAGGVADARYYLHLAAAYHLAQRNEDSLKMLDEAVGFGLEKFLLTGDDRQFLEELNSLKEKSTANVGSPT